MAKVTVVVTDKSGKQTSFGTKTLTKLFKNNKGQVYKVQIQEPGQDGTDVGTYTVKGGVIPPNENPVVEAGENRTVNHGDLVVIDASARDPEGGTVEVTFIQEGGIPVVLERDPNDITIASFLAPEENTIITFGVIAKDEQGATSTDKVVITVGVPDVPVECPEGKHKDDSGNCVPDEVEPPVEGLLFDSNTDIDWAAIKTEFLKVDDTYGNVKANGKGFHCNASGNPRAYLYPATKEIVLEHDGEYGRLYFAVCNYQSRMECEFKLDKPDNKASFKLRNRHQYRDMVDDKASDAMTQGGQGTGIGIDEIDADCEVVHGTEVSGPQAKISPKLEANKWYPFKFSQYDKEIKDKDGKVTGHVIHVVDEIDRGDGKGFVVINEGDVKVPSQFFNKAVFEEWSEFWVRMNTPKRKNNRLTIRNLKMYKL